MTRVLVTGVDGFTGRYLAPLLAARGREVHGLVHQTLGPGRPPVVGVAEVHSCNLLDAEALRRAVAAISPDSVVHLAAIAFVAHGDVDAIYRTNIVGSRNLLAALSALPVRPSAVLLASSANVYGNTTEGVIDETTEPAPANDYAVSKLAMEHMARLWREHLPITVVRPFNYSGVGQSEDFLLPKIVAHFRRRAPLLELGNLDIERDFSDVRDVAGIYCELLSNPNAIGRTVNVCSGTATSLREVLETVSAQSGHLLNVRVNQAFVRANEVRRLVGSRTLLETLVPAPKPTPIADTLRWMLEN